MFVLLTLTLYAYTPRIMMFSPRGHPRAREVHSAVATRCADALLRGDPGAEPPQGAVLGFMGGVGCVVVWVVVWLVDGDAAGPSPRPLHTHTE